MLCDVVRDPISKNVTRKALGEQIFGWTIRSRKRAIIFMRNQTETTTDEAIELSTHENIGGTLGLAPEGTIQPVLFAWIAFE
jgi:hypothetical protein